MHVLFVCTGNICRSPTAERLVRASSDRMRIRGVTATSAGTRAVIGGPVHQESAAVLRSLGGDPSDFAARQFSADLASNADLVVTMTRAHRDKVLEIAPRLLRRTFTLAEASALASTAEAQSIADLAALRPQLSADRVPDVMDPIGQSPEVFAAVGAQIADLLPPLIEFCRRASRIESE